MRPVTRITTDGRIEIYDWDDKDQPVIGHACQEGQFLFWVIVLADGTRVETGTTILGIALSKLAERR